MIDHAKLLPLLQGEVSPQGTEGVFEPSTPSGAARHLPLKEGEDRRWRTDR